MQFIFADTTSIRSRTLKPYSPTSHSPPANKIIIEGGTCESPPPFPTEPPISRPYNMALATEAKRIAAEFELTDNDVKKIGVEFIEQMSACNQISQLGIKF